MIGFWELAKEKIIKDFNYDLLNEGLIMSVDYDFAIQKINNLIKKFNIDGYCELYKGKDRLILNSKIDNIYARKNFFNDFQSLLNNLGYYVSNYKINDNLFNHGIDYTTFIKNEKITIYLNKKFDAEKGIPEFLYHVTEKKYIEKIKIKGLISKSKKIIENHPERIYFFENLDNCYEFIDFKNLEGNCNILQVDTKTLHNIKLYEDPKYVPYIKAFYTYDNIPPYSLKIIE